MITIISGTNRKKSISKQLAIEYQKILNDLSEESIIIDLVSLPQDFIFSALYENQGTNLAFNSMIEQMKQSKKLVFIIPEYNGSFPGIVKTFIDALEFPKTLKGKKCALLGLSSGLQGGIMAMSHLTDIFHYLGVEVLALKPKLSSINEKMVNGKLVDKSSILKIKEQAKAFIEF